MRLGEWLLRVTLESDTLTAEQMREFLERHSMFDDATWSHGTAELVFDEDELQVMADELNAMLGGLICEPKWMLQDETQTQEFWCCECGNCGECFGVETRESFPLKVTIDRVSVPNFCPNCGTRVLKNKE